ncbi:hypothetical protein BJ878DRAFT_420345, partial [Calycina marina]
TLQSAFPNAKLVFLTAAKTGATIYRRSYTHQWFDNWYMALERRDECFLNQDQIRDVLRNSIEFVHGVLQ